RSTVELGEVIDGTSNTLLFGEKYLEPDNYLTGINGGDNESMYTGNNNDVCRVANASQLPRQDRAGYTGYDNFGSAHASGCHFVRCDGSVMSLSYSIDGETYRRLGSRNDRLVV